MKILLITLGVAVVALNLFLWHLKRKGRKAEANKAANHKDPSDALFANSNKSLNSSQAQPLKQSAAAELGISVKQLDRMSVQEIKQLATEKGLI
jgi:hypothetical protein